MCAVWAIGAISFDWIHSINGLSSELFILVDKTLKTLCRVLGIDSSAMRTIFKWSQINCLLSVSSGLWQINPMKTAHYASSRHRSFLMLRYPGSRIISFRLQTNNGIIHFSLIWKLDRVENADLTFESCMREMCWFENLTFCHKTPPL